MSNLVISGFKSKRLVTGGFGTVATATVFKGPFAGRMRPHGLRSQPKPALLVSKPQDHRERTQNPR